MPRWRTPKRLYESLIALTLLFSAAAQAQDAGYDLIGSVAASGSTIDGGDYTISGTRPGRHWHAQRRRLFARRRVLRRRGHQRGYQEQHVSSDDAPLIGRANVGRGGGPE